MSTARPVGARRGVRGRDRVHLGAPLAAPAFVVLALLCSLAASGPAADPGPPAASFTIRADRFDRGNVRASAPGTEYADRYPCIWNAGQVPNRAEYDLDFPVTAEYTIAALYAAADPRPVDILLDGSTVARGFGGVTGSWQTSTARWDPQRAVPIAAGRHTIALVCPGPCFPHICALRFESPAPFPAGWRLSRRPPGGDGGIEPFVPRAHRLLAAALGSPSGLPGGPALTAEVLAAG